MTDYPAGTVLTCAHPDCDCRVLIEAECNCNRTEQTTYMCACGTPLTPVHAATE